MGRYYSVEIHPQKAAIEKDILSGMTNNAIAKKYASISHESVRHYKEERMPQILRHAQLETVDGLIGRINEYMDTVEALRDAIVAVLEDPDNPGHLCYYPKADEIKVKYYDEKTEKYAVKKLQDLLQDAGRKKDVAITGAYIEGSDPRLTLLKTSDVLNRQLELLCKAKGYITEENNITISAEASGTVEDIANIAREALAPYPEALEAFVNALLNAAADGDEKLMKDSTGGVEI